MKKTLAILIVLAMVLTACGGDDDVGGATATPADSAAIMAAAVEQLVTVDHTFGSGEPPVTQYLMQSNLDPAAGSGLGTEPLRALTDAERDSIEAVLTPLGDVMFIEDPDDFRTPDLTPTVEGAVIVGVGEPTIDGESATAPVSLWCGGLCGTWFSYRLAKTGDGWVVTGIDGPIAIS